MREMADIKAKPPGLTRRNSASKACKTATPPQSPVPLPGQILQLHKTIGNQAVQRLYRTGFLQAKLRIGQPNDVYEQEADRIAERVMRMPDAAVSFQHQAKAGEQGTATATPWAEASLLSLKDSGKQLSAQEREFFEPRFGTDLGGVRIHASAEAGMLSHSLGAEAFTLGQHIYFASGSYNRETSGGRRLLAHELTHVVQQAGQQPSSPGIQRKLLVDGKPKDVKALLDLLEPASGFTLKHDPKTHEVSTIASRLKPSSFVLAGQLATIMDDPKQDAELSVGRNQPGVGFGKFPGAEDDAPLSAAPVIQEVDVADLEAVEAGSPGSGVALLIHEIVENYHAHQSSLSKKKRSEVFHEAHEEALETEGMVAGELGVGTGKRVADMAAPAPSGDIRTVLDYENYYLVYDQHGNKNKVVNARKVGRVKVSTYDILFKAGSNSLPDSAPSTIRAVVADLERNPFATVRIEGVGDPVHDKKTRMALVMLVILGTGQGHKWFDIRSENNFHLVGNDTTNFKQRVVITVERPDI